MSSDDKGICNLGYACDGCPYREGCPLEDDDVVACSRRKQKEEADGVGE